MKAFRLVAPGKTDLVEIPRPEPGDDEALIRVQAAGVCHSDLHIIHSPAEAGFPLPMTLGHEIAGAVEIVGSGIKNFQIGQQVAVYGIIGCGHCSACLRGKENQCRLKPLGGIGLSRDGGMAEFVAVPATQLISAEGIDPVQAAPLTDAGLTPFHAIDVSRENLRPGAWCVVIGAGGLGHMALQILRATSGARVIALDTDEKARENAKMLGAEYAFPSDDSAVAKIRELVGRAPGGADVVLDFVGIQATLEIARKVVATGGNLTIIGLGAGELKVVPTVGSDLLVPAETKIEMPFWGTKAELLDVLHLSRHKMIEVQTQTFSLDEAPQVYQRLEKRQIRGRAVILPNK
jgi:propanol-preferring alcohol dehydrogenase